MYSDQHDLSVLVIRFGAVLGDDIPEMRRHYPGYLSHADAVQMMDRCLSAPDSIKYDIFEAISDNKYAWRDLAHSREVLGYDPTGSAEDYDIDDKGGWHQVNMS